MKKITAEQVVSNHSINAFHITDNEGRIALDVSVEDRGRDYVDFYVINGDWHGRLDRSGYLTVSASDHRVNLLETGHTIYEGPYDD